MAATRIGPGGAAGLPASSRQAPVVEFEIDGRRVTGIEGEPLAVALLVAGRRILSRSFRFHRPRGLMCSTGQCGWCECEVDGAPSVRTCRVPLRAGMIVRGEHALPSVQRDLLALLDAGSRWVPPTFYHHRFRRPRALRKAYLDVLRWFGGRGRLDPRNAPPRRSRPLRRERCDVLVVGAGPSGMAAAAAAAKTGARVMTLESDSDARPAGPGVRLATTATGWYGGIVAAIDPVTVWLIDAPAVVVATGSYEVLPPVPGADRPGVMSARLVQRLVERHAVLPGRRALLVGSGAELDAAGAALRSASAATIGPVDTEALLNVEGLDEVRGARVRGDAVVERHAVDLVVFADRAPSLELLLAAGAAVHWDGGRLSPMVDRDGRTSVAGLFVVGGAADRSGDLGAAERAGVAAASAAHPIADAMASRPATPPSATGRPARGSPVPHAEALACFCEDVRVREIVAECAAGYGDPELLKRRTGALTGPCQGKYCLPAVIAATAAGTGWVPPTTRPPLQPIRLGDLVGPHPLADPDLVEAEP